MDTITWFGHSAFKIDGGGASVIIDPFLAPSTGLKPADLGKADLVLVTHDHGDHVGCAIEYCRETQTHLGCVVGTAQALVERGLPQNLTLSSMGFNIGGTVEVAGMKATMAQAFHSSDTAVPVSYIVTMPDGLRFYHAGDTGIFQSMELLAKLYPLDLALLPIGGFFTMDAFQAAHAAKMLDAPNVIPMHWGTFPVLAQSPDEFFGYMKEICPATQCLRMAPGQSVEMEHLKKRNQ